MVGVENAEDRSRVQGIGIERTGDRSREYRG